MHDGFPRIIRFRATFPFDQILEEIFDTVKNLDIFDFEVIMIIFDIKGQRSRSKPVQVDQC